MTQRNTIYDAMKFEDYAFREYPKAVPMLDGKPSGSAYHPKTGKPLPIVKVASDEEYEALLDGAPVAGGRVRTEADDRADLYVEAAQCGAVIDKRWSVEKLAVTISEHKAKAASADVV